MDLSGNAIKFVKNNKSLIIDKFANKNKFLPVEKPFTIFMAGSPGAGKTEFSTSFDPKLYAYECNVPIVRIDADEIRKMLPGYNGTNASVFQRAATIGVEKLFDYVNHSDQNAILDTTFSDLTKAKMNIDRSLKHNRKVGIFYIHLEPITAWAYTKIREKNEGRYVNKDFFIKSYIAAKDTVNIIKKLYPKIELNVVDKIIDKTNQQYPIKPTIRLNAPNVDNFITFKYNKEQLLTML
jgi:predicted ABC-type ATPase